MFRRILENPAGLALMSPKLVGFAIDLTLRRGSIWGGILPCIIQFYEIQEWSFARNTILGTNIDPSKWWLGDDFFFFWGGERPIFWGAEMLVSGRVPYFWESRNLKKPFPKMEGIVPHLTTIFWVDLSYKVGRVNNYKCRVFSLHLQGWNNPNYPIYFRPFIGAPTHLKLQPLC